MASGTGRIKLIEEKQAKEQMKSIFVEASHACNIEENPEGIPIPILCYHGLNWSIGPQLAISLECTTMRSRRRLRKRGKCFMITV